MPDHYLTALRDLEAYWENSADLTETGGSNDAMQHLIEIRKIIESHVRTEQACR